MNKNKKNTGPHTWAVGHSVKVTIGQHEMFGPTFRFQFDSDVGDLVIVAGEAAQKIDAEGAGGTLDVHRDRVVAQRALCPDALHLTQKVVHRLHLILQAAHGPRTQTGDVVQVLPGE